jgi:hypothetical protein
MIHERLIAGYLAHAAAITHDQQDSHFWAYLRLHRMTETQPERAWPLVLAVVQRTSDPAVLNYVAADILEDILCIHATALVDRVETLAREDQHFRRALGEVWGWSRMPADVRARLDRAVGRVSRGDDAG